MNKFKHYVVIGFETKAAQEKYFNGHSYKRIAGISGITTSIEQTEQGQMAHEFLMKTNGSSTDKSYVSCPDYWHDLGWDKDLNAYFKKFNR